MNTKQLRQKILDLAIRGQLVPQDSNDEPASVLLEKIRAEKQTLIEQKKIKKDKKSSYITCDLSPYRKYTEYFSDGSSKDITNEIPFEIPENWAWCRGYEILNPMESQKPLGEKFGYLDIASIDNKNNKISEVKFIATSDAPSRASRKVKFGDTLFSMVRPYLRNIAFVEKEYSKCIASTGFYICSPNETLYSKFLFYLMLSEYVVEGVNKYMKGDNSPSINNENITNFLYPLPPLAEQKRIVEKIEELLALVDDLETNKTDLQSYIKQAKSKVLEMAVRGELVPQNPEDEPASVLLERIKKEQKSSKSKGKNTEHNTHYEEELLFDIPKNWALCRLGEVCEIIMGQSPKSENISKKGKLEFHQGKIFFTSKYIQSSESYTNEITKIAPKNSVLICVRAPVGEVNITNRKLCIGRGLCSIVPLQEMSEIFVYYWTKILKEKFIQKATGSTFASISIDIIRNEIIPLPPLSEQHRIVEKIEEIFSELEFIEENLI